MKLTSFCREWSGRRSRLEAVGRTFAAVEAAGGSPGGLVDKLVGLVASRRSIGLAEPNLAELGRKRR